MYEYICIYEGEWAEGEWSVRAHMQGGYGYMGMYYGAHTQAKAVNTPIQVKAGRWRDGQLEAPLELWQCANAVAGAADVATAAKE